MSTRDYQQVNQNTAEDDNVAESNNNKPSKFNKKSVIFLIATALLMLTLIVVLVVFVLIESRGGYPSPPTSSPVTTNCMNDRKLIIISLDGFSHTYLNKTKYNISTPNIDYYFKQNGVSMDIINGGLKVTYPTKTYSSHYSIVTGMYPRVHGIVSNQFYDPILNESFDIRTHKEDDTGKWYRGEPIWNTAKLKNIKSAAFYYPATLANCSARYTNISGYPTFHYHKYVYDWLFMDQINKSMELLILNYSLMLLYMYQPDYYGHKYGPHSVQVKQQIEKIDDEIGVLMNMLRLNNLFNQTDIIIISDHGMTDVQLPLNNINITISKQIIINSTIFNFDSVKYYTINSAVIFIYLYDYQNVTQYVHLMNLAIMNNKEYYTIYENGNIPYNFNNGYHQRIPDFIMEAFIGYTFYTEMKYNTALGNHGYNNSETEMYGIFFASGPSFKSNYQINNTIDSIHLYPLFCKLLCDVEPNPQSNGSIEYLNHVLN